MSLHTCENPQKANSKPDLQCKLNLNDYDWSIQFHTVEPMDHWYGILVIIDAVHGLGEADI